jgi:hypothetical protein
LVALDAGFLPGGTDVRAGKPARYHVSNAIPWPSVEGTNIVPNGERWQVAFILSLHESSGTEGIDFHGTDCALSEQLAREYSASSACEKCQLIHRRLPGC